MSSHFLYIYFLSPIWYITRLQPGWEAHRESSFPVAALFVIFSWGKISSSHNVLFILCLLPEALALLIKMSVWMQNTALKTQCRLGMKKRSLYVFTWPMEASLAFSIKSCLNLIMFRTETRLRVWSYRIRDAIVLASSVADGARGWRSDSVWGSEELKSLQALWLHH